MDDVDSEEMDAYCRKENSSEINSNSSVSVYSAFVVRGIMQMKFLLTNSESAIILPVINPMA
jgi:hypothetical protein